MAKFNDLYQAVKDLDCARLRQLVRGGADINCRDSMRRTVLHHAAANIWVDGMKNVIRTLVDFGADINAGDMRRMTLLHFSLAAMDSHVGIADHTASAIAFLISLGADVNAKCDIMTSLHRAIQLQNIRGIETLLRLGVDVNAYMSINYTALSFNTLLEHLVELGADINSSLTLFQPLHQAIELGRLDIVKLLVQHGAEVNGRRQEGPGLFDKMQTRLPLVLKSLGQLGADLNAKVSSSSTINEIVKVGRVDILEYIVRHGAKDLNLGFTHFTLLKNAVKADYYEMVEFLLKNGADVNLRYDELTSPFVTAMRLGDTKMVRALAKLAPYLINAVPMFENYTVLYRACETDPKILELLLNYGGDVNVKYVSPVTLVHEAVALGNGEMLRVLAELGANLNAGKDEGVGLIQRLLEGSEKAERQMAFIKVLIEAGVDLNQCYNKNVTPLHDAVRLGDLDMVQILIELKADLFETKGEETPLFSVVLEGRADLVRYFVDNGSDVNRKITTHVTPIHDAVRKGDVDMVRLLTTCGAHLECQKHIRTVLHYAARGGNNGVVKCLLECGADINAKASLAINALHDAVEMADLRMIDVLADSKLPVVITNKLDQVTSLGLSIQYDQPDITETLLKHGADLNCSQHIEVTPLDVALDHGNLECSLLLLSRIMGAYRDTIGIPPLHIAFHFGHVDLARLLIIEGCDVNKLDTYGNTPVECLRLPNTVDYHVLQETFLAAKVAEQVPTSSVSTSGCQDMTTSLHTPGIGDVNYISSLCERELSQKVKKRLRSAIQQCKEFPGKTLKPIGSSAEGTRVGLPNEMDFLLRVGLDKDEEMKTVDLGNGYAKYDYQMDAMNMFLPTTKKHNLSLRDRNTFPKGSFGSAGFHSHFIESVLDKVVDLLTKNAASDENVPVFTRGAKRIIEMSDRKACSPLKLEWNGGSSAFTIPVDIVPSLHIDNWPEGATTRTWLMGENELRSRGYVLVPKPPHVKSGLAKEYTEEELRELWKISFPHLETEHMQRLEQRVKDVYITAKCLRNPDVCRIMITDEGSLPRTVSKYVTSYQLKMCFFKNVEYFLQHDDLCLEEMVCKVYDDLVLGLSKNFIPLFFLPKVSALSGIKVDVPKCLKVAKIMARFVRAVYLRDSLGDITDGGDDLVMTVYQRNPGSVYRVYDISDDQVTTVYQRNPRSVHRH